MARCNAKMHSDESKNGVNGYNLYRTCDILKRYISKYHTKQVDKHEWKGSLRPIYHFFLGCSVPSYFLTDIPGTISILQKEE